MKSNISKTFLGFSKEQWSEYVCPVLLATAVCFASFYTFSKGAAFVLTLLFSFECVFLFRLFGKLRERKRGGLIYALMLFAAVSVSYVLLTLHRIAYGYFAPMRWFYAQDNINGFQPLLIFALFIGGGFFLISIIYYFTVVRFRVMGIMLCTMFPFFFFAKRSDIMPDILITLIMLLFLAVIIHNKRLRGSDTGEGKIFLKVDRAYVICIAVFVLITGAFTMAAEKPYYQAFLEKNQRLLSPFTMNFGGASGYEELSERSTPRNITPSYNYEPLFYFDTDSAQSEIFLRTKAYDYFDSEVWTTDDTALSVFYSLNIPEYSTDDIASDLCALTNKPNDSLYAVRSGRIHDDRFTPRYLPAPYATITDNGYGDNLEYYKSSYDTSILRTTSYYYVPSLDDSFNYYESLDGLYAVARGYNFSSSEYLAFLDKNAGSEQAKRLKEDYQKAFDSYSDVSNISLKLIDLSHEITADCHSDLEKAQRLENYFSDNGFKYSLDYVPDDNSIDYFVFESKTGFCASYATAMTLMARAIGLPARYVEGFAAFERDSQSGQFIVRDNYAHAFVEIYIPCAGWMTFDPTVSDYRAVPDITSARNAFGFLSRIFSALNRISVIIVIAVLVLAFSLVDRIKELIVRVLIYSKETNERIILLYANLIRVIGESVNSDFSAYTPDMIRDYLLENRGVVPEKLISLFEKTAFGGYNCGKEEFNEAYKEYKSCYKYLRKSRRLPREKALRH